MRYFHPDVPEFMKFFQAYSKSKLEQNEDRNVKDNVMKLLDGSKYWECVGVSSIVISSTLIGNLELFRDVYRNVIRMVEMTGELDYDYEPVSAEWDEWCQNERAYAQVGLNLLQYQRA